VTYQSITHPFILFLTLLLYFSLSLSLWWVCACVRACPSLLLSLAFALAFSLMLSVCLFLSLLHTHSRTSSHTFSLIHSLTHAHTHQIFIPVFLTHSHTFRSLSLSDSLYLSYSHTLIHTHTHTLTYSLAHPHIHFCRVCALHCLQRAYARALSPLCFSPPSSLSYSFPLQFCLFFSLLPSRSLASSPSFSHSFDSSLFQILVAMISI